jgi:ParB family chromosome partitioning protein
LGRGLDALIPSAGVAAARDPARTSDAETAAEIPLERIDRNPEQPRRVFDDEQMERLAESIRVHGVLQPVVVRRLGDRFELVVGERRWRAARQAGLDTIPAVVADIDAQDRIEVALVENVQRRDLNPIELGFAFRALADTGATQDEIGRRVGLDRSTIANHLRLLELPGSYQEDVEAERLSTGHAKALLQMTNPERRHQLRNRIIRDGLSVRAAEELARSSTPAAPRRRQARAALDPNLQRAADALRERLQTRVRIKGDDTRGRIEIEYFGAEDLERISDLLLGDA